MSLDRFLTAQASPQSGFTTALAELQSGRKTSHWIWYLLPQLEGLGRSSTAKFYGLKDAAEAADYLRNPTLRGNLLALLDVIAVQLAQGSSLRTLMGSAIDATKLVSSVTLFERIANTCRETNLISELSAVAQRCTEILGRAEQQGCLRCELTLSALDAAASKEQ